MKPQTLPVKRRPAPKGIFKRLSAVTRNRKQRVAAAAASEMESDDGSSKISRALTIIFLIHIVAIGLIFIHQRFLDGRPSDTSKAEAAAAKIDVAPPAQRRLDLPRLASGEKPYIVRAGDNYARIATAEGVDEADLRLINKHVEIRPGLVMKIPPKRITAVEPAEVTAIRQQHETVDIDDGLVEVPVDVSNAPRARLVRPNGQPAEAAKPAASGQSYVVQPGDSIWRIANRYKVDQDQLMKANGITDPRKVKIGMNLVIPR